MPNINLNGKQQGFQYSTEEQWTGEYWIDGSKIYTKYFTYVTHSKDTRLTLDKVGISNIKEVWVDMKNSFAKYSTTNSFPSGACTQSVNNFISTTDWHSCYIDSGSKLTFLVGATTYYWEWHIILLYTRTD